MSKLFTLVGRLWAWLVPHGAARPKSAAELSPVERLLQHREHLFGSAVQLLDDESAAQQVVLEALTHAVKGPLLPVAGARAVSTTPGAAVETVELASEQSLVRWLDRMVVNLSVTRLKALALVGAARSGQSQDGWPAVRDPELPGEPGQAGALGPGEAAGPSGSFPVAAPVAGSVSGSPSGPGFTVASEQAQLQRTAHVLGQLPTETRVALMLIVMQGRTVAETAELLGCSEVTCRFLLSHGLKLMRRALQRDLIEDDFVSRESRLLLSPGALNDLRRSKKAAARA